MGAGFPIWFLRPGFPLILKKIEFVPAETPERTAITGKEEEENSRRGSVGDRVSYMVPQTGFP